MPDVGQNVARRMLSSFDERVPASFPSFSIRVRRADTVGMTLQTVQTARLVLVPMTAALVDLEINDPIGFAAQIQADVPPEWPPEQVADALPWFAEQLNANPALVGWLGWYGLWQRTDGSLPLLVGSGGFLGPPTEGAAEIGYAVLPSFQGQGFATEMIDGLIGWAFSQPDVIAVVAETGQSNGPSRRILEKLGFIAAGTGREPDDLRFERTAPTV